MILIAASLYLPEHITTMASRAWFYYAGDEAANAAAAAAAAAVKGSAGGSLRGGGEAGGGGDMERVKEAVRTGAGVVWRRGDTAGVESGIGRRGRIDHGEGLVRGEAARMPGEEILELLGRL